MTKRIYTENGKTFIECKDWHHTDVFEVVDKFPEGYIIWLIPLDKPGKGYIALAKPDSEPYHIIRENLKCMWVGEEMAEKLHYYNHYMGGKAINALNFDDIVKKLSK